MNYFCGVIFLFSLLAAPLSGMQAPVRFDGVITGRVLDEDGSPIVAAEVRLVSGALSLYAGSGTMADPYRTQRIVTDHDGNFRAVNLPPLNFTIEVSVAGYVQSSTAESSAQSFYRPGDHITITMAKGGVITGRVTNSNGEPVIAVQVRALPLQATNARWLDRSLPRSQLDAQRLTDERGIYRLFGLEPGSYLIVANASLAGVYRVSPVYGQDAPAFYPASSPATARPVIVQSGQEVSGIDIRFDRQRGHVISGRLIDPAGDGNPQQDQIAIALTDAASGVVVAAIPTSAERDSLHDFSFDHVPDGDYELTAQRTDRTDIGAAAAPYRVTVKGADVTGIQLKLVLLSGITGHVMLEPANDNQLKCASQLPSLLPSITLSARRDESPQSRRAEKDIDEAISTSPASTPIDQSSNQAAFTLRYLEAGRYRMVAHLPQEAWYVRTMTLPAASVNQSLRDVARDGLTLKPGEITKNLTVTIAQGATSVRGRVIAASDGVKLPAHLRVHLIPAESEQANNVLRYAEVITRSEGSFTFANLAPGKYWLLAQAMSEEEANQPALRLTAWESSERAKLRREAETVKVEIELQPCQRVSDYTLHYMPRQ